MAPLAELVGQRRPTPSNDRGIGAASCCVTLIDRKLVRVSEPDLAPSPLARLVHDQFRALVLSEGFSCLGAKAAFRTAQYQLGVYAAIGSAEATDNLARHLSAFVEANPPSPRGVTTFIASFSGPTASDEATFERLLWAQLQTLHDRDSRLHRWDPSVSADPEDPGFSYSFAGRAFFVVGLHAASSRWARRFAWPTLVFNPHDQFERLRTEGTFPRLQQRIRARERALQTTLNANLSNFGERSEARQYAGRPLDAEWQCPFQARVVSERRPLGDTEVAPEAP